MFQCIVVSLDGSELAEQVLPHATAIAQRFNARLQLLQIVALSHQVFNVGWAGAGDVGGVPPDVTVLDTAFQTEADRAGAYLEGIAASLRSTSVQVAWEVRQGTPAQEIAECAPQHEADLIALSTHGRGGLASLLFGSVADRVLREARIPVLLITSEG